VMHTAIKWLVPAQRYSLGEPLIGASGAISAIVAPFAVRYHRAQIRLVWLPGLLARSDWGQLEVPALAGLSLWVLQNLAGAIKSIIVPASGGTAYWAHLGGFAFGLVASELGGLLREGRQDYLLQEARGGANGPDAAQDPVRKYRAFLDHDPNNLAVRIELARALARQSADPDEGRREAVLEILAALRAAQRARRWTDAVRLYSAADALTLALPLSPRERLRLAGSAEEAGDPAVAISLLRALTAETPDAPEDEMARLKLGQLLAPTDPDEARSLLTAFLQKYPGSDWAPRARELMARTSV